VMNRRVTIRMARSVRYHRKPYAATLIDRAFRSKHWQQAVTSLGQRNSQNASGISRETLAHLPGAITALSSTPTGPLLNQRSNTDRKATMLMRALDDYYGQGHAPLFVQNSVEKSKRAIVRLVCILERCHVLMDDPVLRSLAIASGCASNSVRYV
jgi:hypothetical protein